MNDRRQTAAATLSFLRDKKFTCACFRKSTTKYTTQYNVFSACFVRVLHGQYNGGFFLHHNSTFNLLKYKLCSFTLARVGFLRVI